ncbi:MAG: long-chain fatty acid--CoA ligase [Solirubrobacterales bacterium]|nr:long-chain fatty acid--CoA ligase [Solirubrobacterales bacterium]MBV9715359.1 long-chain fatty acid--CoA ligase [Solirubrobacterales bacterium]
MSDTASSPRTIASTVASLPRAAAERFAANLAARYKVDGEWREYTYAEIGEAIEELALGLVSLGIEPGDRVCILADTRVEWTIASYAISAAGAVVVPIYPTNSPRECEWVAGDSGARAVFCADEAQRRKFGEIRTSLDALEHVIGIEPGGGEPTLAELRERGRSRDRGELLSRQENVRPGDTYTIIYTSGTTGPPKGVVLTHANAMSVCQMVEEIEFVEPGEVTYLYLPLAHSFALTSQLASYDEGTAIVYYGGNTQEILAEIIETKPTYIPSVPRIFEKLYAAAMKLQEAADEADRERFRQAIKLGVEVRRRRQRGEEVPPQMQEPFERADAQIFQRVRGLFGGHVRQAVSGAAPIAPEILEFFYACGVPVLEGWGMTETVAVGTVGTLDHFKFGTVGRPMPGIEMRVAEDGEILMRGPNVFPEYWRNPEATAETLRDGWLHTGDVGEIDDEGYLKITGRKKDIIITAGGKNLTPANIENDLKQSRFISQAVMFGDRKPYPVALITLDPDEVGPWAQEQGLPADVRELAEHERVHEIIQRELDRANANYAQVEQVKRFTILDRDLSIDTGELTPTLKVKRNVIYERYSELFESMYG